MPHPKVCCFCALCMLALIQLSKGQEWRTLPFKHHLLLCLKKVYRVPLGQAASAWDISSLHSQVSPHRRFWRPAQKQTKAHLYIKIKNNPDPSEVSCDEKPSETISHHFVATNLMHSLQRNLTAFDRNPLNSANDKLYAPPFWIPMNREPSRYNKRKRNCQWEELLKY